MILCFSGTGNSRKMAELLALRLSDRVVDLPVCENDEATLPEPIRHGERVVWVLPVHSWGLPKVVRKAIRRFNLPEGYDMHYLVCTCGDDCGLTDKMWRRELKRRGWKSRAAHSVFMPNTYVNLPGFDVDNDDIVAAKLDAMPERVDQIGHAIKCSSPVDSIHRGKLAWVKTRLIYPLFMSLLTSPRPFKADDQCTKCGRCARVCPLGNIRVGENVGPQWGANCTMCLACYHTCPRHSINYGRVTRSKGQWQGSLKRP
ncbi:MAG: EFR1 family ferrodoxin [Bacteroides sp.]|nr:EFR1 family ferrodoxin [Bacteroides sp.]MCM1414112.1 EFR1 family ferrodoxin [Bacteroides sp.]MCM1472376.1 EFR1 family ferrodoxin [Bacteroides sp.]